MTKKVKVPITISVVFNPRFSLLDEKEGKRLIYYNTVESVECDDPDFKKE